MGGREGAEAEEQILRIASGCNPAELTLNPQEGFLLSRIDGVTSWKLVRDTSSMPPDLVDDYLRTWLDQGLLEVVLPTSKEIAKTKNWQEKKRSAASAPLEIDASLDLPEKVQSRILEFEPLLKKPYHEILGVRSDADPSAVKKAYFKLAKEFHPDLYFGKDLGPFAEMLEQVFMKIVVAYELLSDPIARIEIEKSQETVPSPAPTSPVRETKSKGPQFRKLAHLSRARMERKMKAKALYESGMESAGAEKWLEAASSLRLAIAFDPENEIFKISFAPVQVKANEIRATKLIKEAQTAADFKHAEQALKLYEDAVGLRPHDADLNHRVAELAWMQSGSHLRLAKECGQAAVDLEPDNMGYRITLGRVYRDAGMGANAKREFEYILKVEPGHAEAKAELKTVRRSQRGKR